MQLYQKLTKCSKTTIFVKKTFNILVFCGIIINVGNFLKNFL